MKTNFSELCNGPVFTGQELLLLMLSVQGSSLRDQLTQTSVLMQCPDEDQMSRASRSGGQSKTVTLCITHTHTDVCGEAGLFNTTSPTTNHHHHTRDIRTVVETFLGHDETHQQQSLPTGQSCAALRRTLSGQPVHSFIFSSQFFCLPGGDAF